MELLKNDASTWGVEANKINRNLAITAQLSPSKNLFNKDTITAGYYVNGNTGNIAALANYNASDYIELLPFTNYYASGIGNDYRAFYDANKVFISGFNGGAIAQYGFVTPAGTKYGRFTTLTPLSTQIELGTVASAYEAYELKVQEDKIPSKIARVNQIIANTWIGKKWASDGDSIAAQGLWQPYVVAALGLILTNTGASGWVMGGNNAANNSLFNDAHIATIPSDMDVITIMAGTNDWLNSIIIGSVDSTNPAEFCGGYNSYITKLLTKNPNYKIIIIPTAYGSNLASYGGFTGLTNNQGKTTADYAEASRQIAKKWGFPIADVPQNMGCNAITMPNLLADGVHPNATGAKEYAKPVISGFRTINPVI